MRNSRLHCDPDKNSNASNVDLNGLCSVLGPLSSWITTVEQLNEVDIVRQY